MTKARHKLLGYAVVVVPLALTFFTPFSDSIKRRVFNRYDLRWHFDNKEGQREQVITVHNNGDSEAGKIHIRLNINSESESPVADFAFIKAESGEVVSFLDAVADTEPVRGEEEREVMRPVVAALDARPEERGLYKVEQALNETGLSMLGSAGLEKMADGLRKPDASAKAEAEAKAEAKAKAKAAARADWHEFLKKDCDGKKPPDAWCQQGVGVVYRWKGLKRQLVGAARKNWGDAAGVWVNYPSHELSPTRSADFTFALGAHETGSLRISYNTNPDIKVDTGVNVLSSSAVDHVNEVEDRADLDATLALFMLEYKFLLFAGILILAAAGIVFAWPRIRPKQLLPINRVALWALDTDDYEYWEHFYQRHRFYVLQQFRKYRHEQGKPDLDREPEELLDFVRDQLTSRYYQNRRRFKGRWLRTEGQLNRFIRDQLQILVGLGS